MDSQQGEVEQSSGTSTGSELHAKAQEFKNSGNDKFNKNNYKGAIIDYKKGLLHEPNNSDLHANLSAAYIHLEKYIEAEEHAVYAIQLRPNFYKGYMRAAKAAHGKGMTRLALKRLTSGLSLVTDPNGIKELTRLKTQYTCYLSLESNAEREMEFDSDRYQSEDEYDDQSSDDEDDPPEGEQPPENRRLPYELCGSMISKKEKEDEIKELEPAKSNPPVKEEQKKAVTPTKEAVTLSKATQCSKLDESKPAEGHPKFTDKEVTFNKNEEKKPESVLGIIRDITRDPELKKHIAEFKEHLKTGGEAFLNGNYRKAAESYKNAKERVGLKISDFEIDDRQYHMIKYAHSAALINLNTYDDIVKAIQGLTDMEVYKFSIPALYIQMARAYCKLNRFKNALEPLEKLQEILDNFPIFPTFTWPGTNETIQETTPTGLKNAIKELNQMCRMSHKPTAVCRFNNCSKTSTHILPSELIYISDPDFIGYVRMICEEKCHIEFHIPCWRAYKELICGIGKINDKDFLGRRCLTTDCVNSDGEPSLITVIEIIGSDGQVKSFNKLEPATTVDHKKAKKKKSKLDDKDKTPKPKKTKEKKVREVKKPVAVVEEEEEEEQVEPVQVTVDPVKAWQKRLQSLKDLRASNFGMDSDCDWNPKLRFYGRAAEVAALDQFLDPAGNEEVAVKDAKEFVFSYFLSILMDEGPLKQTEIEDLWKESAGDFCDMSVVLPNLKSMCELLFESSRYCQLEDYICLADQLDEAYETVKTEVVETVKFLMTGSASPSEVNQQLTHSQLSDSLPDLLNHPHTHNNQFNAHGSQSTSEEESEYESGGESDESDEDGSDDDGEAATTTNSGTPEPFLKPDAIQHEEDPHIVPPKPLVDEKFSLQEMLNEMSRVKNIFMKNSNENEVSLQEEDTNRDVEESTSNETFETAIGSSEDTTIDDTKIVALREKGSSESSNDEHSDEIFSSDDHNSIVGESDVTIVPNNTEQTEDIVNIESINCNTENNLESSGSQLQSASNEGKDETPIENQEPSVNAECDKASQSEIPTEERQMQTSPMETKDRLSQTKESELYKELNKKVQDLSSQLSSINKENSKLSKELIDKDTLIKQIKKAEDEAITKLHEENRKNFEKHKAFQEQLKAEFNKKETEFKQKEEDLTAGMGKMKDMCTNLLVDNNQLKKEMSSLVKDTAEMRLSLNTALSNIKEFESNYKTLESNFKTRLQKSQQSQLNTIRVYWESQINLLKKRCVEKISEIQSWFSMFPSEEVEELPSWALIRQNTMQWSEISKKVQQIEADFQVKNNELESKIARGEEIDDLTILILPTLPDEPVPLPLDKIHKEITEKHLKKIRDLTQLVVSQQLEIEKSKETTQQIQQLMNTFQMGPRMQTPMTTAFGSLALQYPYPQTMPPQFGQSPVPTIPPPTPDAAKVGSAAKLLLPDVQKLLLESSKATKFTSITPGKQSVKEENTGDQGQIPPSKTFPFPPPSVMNTVTMPPPPVPTVPQMSVSGMSHPPPPIGVAHNLLKASSSLSEKKDVKLPEGRAGTPKIESTKPGSSRESTPGPASTPTPTPEKSKKKKKSKSESKDTVEARSIPINLEAGSVDHDSHKVDDNSEWSVVMPKSALPKHSAPPSLPVSESKLKNKKKLLDKLQLKFPTTPLKDLDDIVKLVREQNNGSLSGLPFDEIEARVERVITKRQLQKNSTMGLVKFSDAAWGTVKQQEIITWTSLQLEECTICLEPMGTERTRVDCNHEFHTKCLRKWLKEKSVCPLCNKFTTMPDEFPAL